MTAWKGVERGEVLARTCDATAEGARKQLGGSRLRTAKKLGASLAGQPIATSRGPTMVAPVHGDSVLPCRLQPLLLAGPPTVLCSACCLPPSSRDAAARRTPSPT